MGVAKKKKSTSPKDDVIHIRSTLKDKLLIEAAADAVGLTVSSFMLQHAIKAARNELAALEQVVLSKNDSELFFQALLSQPSPSLALEDAFESYKKANRK